MSLLYHTAVFAFRATRRRLVVAALAVVATGAVIRARTPVESRERLVLAGLPAVDLRLILPAYSQSYVPRSREAARAALQRFGEWFGPYPGAELTLELNPPWPAGGVGRRLESEIVRQIARGVWRGPETESDWTAGLAEYARARLFLDLYAGQHFHEARFFGGVVPYVIRSAPVTFDLESDTVATRRIALALRTLERHVGWATLQQALREFVSRWRTGTARPAALGALIGEMTGRDMSWFFDQVLDPSRPFDYGIQQLSSHAEADGRYTTTVVVRRYGSGTFPGSTRLPDGPFQPHGALDVVTTFAGGDDIRDSWDGRAESATFSYASTTPAVSAAIDPDRVLWLDENRANNTRMLDPPTAAAARWAARWMIWLEDALLTYAFLL